MQSAEHWQASSGSGSRRALDGANHYHRSSITLWPHHLLGAFRGAAPCHLHPWSGKYPDWENSGEHLSLLAGCHWRESGRSVAVLVLKRANENYEDPDGYRAARKYLIFIYDNNT